MRTVIALALAIVSFPAPTVATQPDPASSTARRPGWLPRSTRIDPSLSAAERSTVLARINEIERLLLQIPELAKPEGFEVLPIVNAAAFEIWPVIQGSPRAKWITHSYGLMTFRPSKAIAGEGSTCLTVTVNPLPTQLYIDYAQNDFEDGKGDRVYIENRIGARKPGALLAYGHILPGPGESFSTEPKGFSPTNISAYGVFFSADGVSPWLEVTRQAYLEAMIWSVETRDLKELEGARQRLSKTRYQLWMEDAPKRKKERDEALAAVEKVDPAQAAAARKQAEAIERDIGDQLKAAEAEDRAENARTLAQGMPADHLRAKLASMTPEERSMPAWTGGGGSDEFFEPNDPEAVRIVRANPTFYRARDPRVTPRGVMVRFIATLTCHAPAVQRAFHAAYQDLDYGALQRLLVPTPR